VDIFIKVLGVLKFSSTDTFHIRLKYLLINFTEKCLKIWVAITTLTDLGRVTKTRPTLGSIVNLKLIVSRHAFALRF
jgi:hypothetical protein